MSEWIEKPPEGVAGWRQVWKENLRLRPEESGSGLKRGIRGWIQRVVRSVSREDDERQRDFNLALLEMFEDVRRDAEALHQDILTTTKDLAALGVEVQKFQELLPVAVQRNDALLAALDQKIETIAVRIRDITTKLIVAEKTSPAVRNDLLYRRLEDSLRGSVAEVRKNLQPYLEFARKSGPVVDVGCGRGEFLELCREAGIPARGFDTNERSVASLKERGFEAEVGAVPECLDGVTAGSILATHVVEHLPATALFDFFAAASRSLNPGGYLMIETPNADSLAMSGSDFWRDPTHVAPRHSASLILLGREFGFDVEESRSVNDFPEARQIRSTPGTDPALVDQLNERLYGKQDLRLILRKK